jgi:hypothetical protein
MCTATYLRRPQYGSYRMKWFVVVCVSYDCPHTYYPVPKVHLTMYSKIPGSGFSAPIEKNREYDDNLTSCCVCEAGARRCTEGAWVHAA